MAEFTVANFKDVSGGLQEGQFAVGERKKASGLADLDPIYRDLLDMNRLRSRWASSAPTGG